MGLAVPAETPTQVVETLNKAVSEILEQTDILSRMALIGYEPAPLDAPGVADFMSGQYAGYRQAAAEAGFKTAQ
jgi:tripartite-type tricarboxylate transporter receptor subunit TctC